MNPRPRVYLASCKVLPEPDPDEPLLMRALEECGLHAETRGWDDPQATWDDADLVVLRSTWNYHLDRDAFLAWASRVDAATQLYNPLPTVIWNTHKSYLRDLEARGISIVPTVFLARGSRETTLSELCAKRGYTDVVVKPTISAASYSTQRFRGAAELLRGDPFLAEMLRERDVMVQPYVASVDGYGERSLIWIDGEFTHAIRKTPRFAGGHEDVSAALAITADERSFGERVLSGVPRPLLYARVDCARDANDALMVMELELVEPSLFLLQEPAALARLARAIAAHCRGA